MTTIDRYRPSITAAAAVHRIDPTLIAAIVTVESGANPWAWNPEPRYRYFWDVRRQQPFRVISLAEERSETPPPDFPTLGGDRDQEWWGQQASWGLMQIMGAVGREVGFEGIYLPQLCEVERNLEYGCRHLFSLLDWARHDVRQAAAAYNAGRGGWMRAAGQAYADKVQQAMTTLATPRRL